MTQNENYKKVFGISFVSGGFAGIVAKTAVAPLERIKIIYQTSSIPFTYSSALTKAADLYKQNGFLTFYRGNLPNILRITPYSAIQFALFDLLKNLFITKEETSLQLKLKHFLFGSISGLTATIIMHPQDLLRARMAIESPTGNLTMKELIIKTYKFETIKSFYNGLTPAIIGIIIYKGFGFMIFENQKLLSLKFGSDKVNQVNFACGAVAGLSSQIIAYPFDTLKRKLQTMNSFSDKHSPYQPKHQHKIGLQELVKVIGEKEGLVRGLYKGITVNFFKGPIANGISFTTKYYFESLLKKSF